MYYVYEGPHKDRSARVCMCVYVCVEERLPECIRSFVLLARNTGRAGLSDLGAKEFSAAPSLRGIP